LCLQDCLLDFLKLMGDSDRHVRKAAVVALSAVVHHKPGLVTSGLQELMPLLLDQTLIKPEMVRSIGAKFISHPDAASFLAPACGAGLHAAVMDT
jgi:hypothetical protein